MMDVVIRNILSNSVKFTNYNGRIIISAEATGEHILLTIADNGTGMLPEQVDELFHINKSAVHTGTALPFTLNGR